MKHLCYGLTALCLTSAFVTQLLQDGAWIARLCGIAWQVQFVIEVGAGMAATLVGWRIRSR